MPGLDAKLKHLTEQAGDLCQLAYDIDQDRWTVHTCKSRELLGCGRSAEDAIDASCRKVNVLPLVGARQSEPHEDPLEAA